jgi:glycosyltransferase involved in cell wall biosynthesis
MSDPFERSPIAQAPLSVVLTAYNVEAHVEHVLGNWTAYLDTLERDYEILVVNDGSTDRTAESAVTFGTKYPRLRLLNHPTPQGVGAALRTGLQAAQFPLLFYAECGSSYQPADLGRLLEVIDKVDLVSGYRVWQSSGHRRGWRRYAYQGLLRFLYGLRLTDVDCSFKLFRRSIYARIPIQSAGPFVHAEILAKANFLGCLMSEVPVRYEPNQFTPSRPPSSMAWRADAARVFFHPDFGPAVLPEPPPIPHS